MNKSLTSKKCRNRIRIVVSAIKFIHRLKKPTTQKIQVPVFFYNNFNIQIDVIKLMETKNKFQYEEKKISEMEKSTMEEDNSAVMKKLNSQDFGTEFHSVRSFQNSLEEIQFLNKFFNCLKRGSTSDIEFLERALNSDPKMNIYGPKNDKRLGNIDHIGGLFPLYVACQYNNKKAIEILIKGNHKKLKLII